MQFFPDIRTFLSIGPLSIKWYAIFILIGAMLAYWISLREIKKMGYQAEVAEDLFMGCLICGLIGARLWFCTFYNLSYYLANPIEILYVFEGGMAIQGGLFGGVLFGLGYAIKHKLSFMRLADGIVPTLLIAQAIGRWGNFINQEAFGRIVSEAYYTYFPKWFSDMMLIEGAYREPTFLYESVGNLVGFILIVFVYKRFSQLKRGDLVYAYLMWYGVIRLFIEGLRTDSLMFMGLRMAQLVSIAFILVGVAGTLGLFRKMVKQKKPVILFDLDGTLLDTEPAILETYRYLFKKYKTEEEFTREIQLEVLGPSLESMFKKYFPEMESQGLVEEYRQHNWEIHEQLVKPMEGTIDLLEGLKKQGYKLGIVSTKRKDTINLGLQQNKMMEYFDVILGQEEVKKGKPDPEGILKACEMLKEGHDSVIYIGDSAMDIQAAKNAGVFSVGYLFNLDRKERLEAEKPNRIIDHLLQLNNILKEDLFWTNELM